MCVVSDKTVEGREGGWTHYWRDKNLKRLVWRQLSFIQFTDLEKPTNINIFWEKHAIG